MGICSLYILYHSGARGFWRHSFWVRIDSTRIPEHFPSNTPISAAEIRLLQILLSVEIQYTFRSLHVEQHPQYSSWKEGWSSTTTQRPIHMGQDFTDPTLWVQRKHVWLSEWNLWDTTLRARHIIRVDPDLIQELTHTPQVIGLQYSQIGEHSLSSSKIGECPKIGQPETETQFFLRTLGQTSATFTGLWQWASTRSKASIQFYQRGHVFYMPCFSTFPRTFPSIPLGSCGTCIKGGEYVSTLQRTDHEDIEMVRCDRKWWRGCSKVTGPFDKDFVARSESHLARTYSPTACRWRSSNHGRSSP
jgi:hypothetical protein